MHARFCFNYVLEKISLRDEWKFQIRYVSLSRDKDKGHNVLRLSKCFLKSEKIMFYSQRYLTVSSNVKINQTE